MNLKDNGNRGYLGGFGGWRGRGECYNILISKNYKQLLKKFKYIKEW